MPQNWKTYKLGDFAKLRKETIKPTEFNGEHYIGLEHIGQGSFLLDGLGIASDATSNKSKFKSGDILYGKIRPYFKKVYRPKFEGICSTDIFVIKTKDEEIITQDFLHQIIKAQDFTDKATETSSGTKMPRADWNSIKTLEYSLPSLEEQKAIAQILSAIDDKIENNLAINKTLEEMARALYKHWFVDFGPFQDGAFVESELGEIPEGWEVKTLGELSKKLSKGTTPKMKDKGDLECTIPFLKVKDLNDNGEIDQSNIEYIPETIHLNQLKRSVLENEDLLFSIAGTIGRVSIIPESLDNSNCNQALAFIRLKDKEKLNTFVYNWLKSEETQQKIESSIVQGVQANVSLTVLKELDIIIPSELIVENFSKQANPIHDKILENQVENQTLTQLRDTLLPKLISGQVRLKEFEVQIETAL